MAVITPQDGILDIQGIVKNYGIELLTEEILFENLFTTKFVAAQNINASSSVKIIVVDSTTGYDQTTGLLKGSVITSYDQTIIGVVTESVNLNSIGNLIDQKAIVASGFNCSGSNIGDRVYCNSSGNLTFTVTPKLIGVVAANTNPGIIYININLQNDLYLLSLIPAIPVGSVYPYLGNVSPTGFLLCAGGLQSTTSYPELFSLLGYNYGGSGGNFGIPDYRGVFLRGIGSQVISGVTYSGPALHTSQLDAMQGHRHNYDKANSIGFIYDTGSLGGGLQYTSTNSSNPVTDGVNGTPRTANETRPVNYGVNYIIKT